MSSVEPITISAKDCLPFEEQEHGNAIQYFAKQEAEFELFHFGKRDKDIPNLIEFDSLAGKWNAGRLIGETHFDYEGKKYLLTINPRFGKVHLFRMLEEIFNVRITESKHSYDSGESKQQLIKKLISFIWLHLLAKANRHGLPRVSQPRTYYGSKIKGHINVRESLIPIKTEHKMVSTYRQKAFDDRILRTLKVAYEILLSEYYLGKLKQSYNAKHAIGELNRSSLSSRKFSRAQYQQIKVKRIYQTYKPVLDLSWDIIRNNRDNARKRGDKQSFSYFIDIAEIWEMYLRSLLKKRFALYGWNLVNHKIMTYPDKVFMRGLIPDIVFIKGKRLIIFDAKYKRMQFNPNDIDRSDFFQIHTYIQYYQQNYKVIAGGLLYPFSSEFNKDRKVKSMSNSLFGESSDETKFFIDGINLTDSAEGDFDFNNEEEKFLNRMELIIQ